MTIHLEPEAEAKGVGALVLGLGNVLLGDDGIGAAAIARMAPTTASS